MSQLRLLLAVILLVPAAARAEEEGGHRLYKQIDRELEASSREIGRLKVCYAQRRKALADFSADAKGQAAALGKPSLEAVKGPAMPADPKSSEFRKCLKDFRMEATLNKPNPEDKEKGLVTIDYYHCMALATGPKACEGLRRLGKGAGRKWAYHEICGEFVTRAGVVKRLADKSPTAVEACTAEMNRYAPPEVDKPRFCGDLARGAGYDVICAQAQGAEMKAGCREVAGRLLGDPKVCAELKPDSFTRQGCDLAAAYRKAKAAGSAKDCGEDAMCAALMGAGPGVCDAKYRQPLAEAYCTARAPRAFDYVDSDYRKTLENISKADEEKAATVSGPSISAGTSKLDALKLADAKKKAIDASCEAPEKDLRVKLDKLSSLIDGVEPKSTVGLDDRQERFRTIQAQFEAARKSEYGTRPKQQGPIGKTTGEGPTLPPGKKGPARPQYNPPEPKPVPEKKAR